MATSTWPANIAKFWLALPRVHSGFKADHKTDQQRDSENSYDALIPPMAAHTTDTTPFDIPNAITHTLLLPQNSALAGVGRSTITSAVAVPNHKLKGRNNHEMKRYR